MSADDNNNNWPEIAKVAVENRHELVLSGAEAAAKLVHSDGNLPKRLYSLRGLNFLEVSKVGLKCLSPNISHLASLTQLVLCNNQLSEVPTEIGILVKLKTLDLSYNYLQSIPESIGNLKQLSTLIVSNNKLEELPDFSELLNLTRFDCSFNQLSEIPISLISNRFLHLTELMFRSNKITLIVASISDVPNLKCLDLRENLIENLPLELGECGKLKELELLSNPLKDRRLSKIVADPHHKISALLDAIRKHGIKPSAESAQSKGSKAKKSKKNKNVVIENQDELPKDKITINIMNADNNEWRVVKTAVVEEVRPYLACCIVRDLHLDADGRFKKFLNLQNKMHADESLCKKRCAAAIATHDLNKIVAPLKYTAIAPHKLMITPLGSGKEESGKELVDRLTEEAEQIRKKEKRNNFSGIYKYLNLVKGIVYYPCIIDGEGKVISFAPVTNSQVSKMVPETSDLFVEVSSSESQTTCKRIMDRLIYEMLSLGLGTELNVDDEMSATKTLHVEQVKVVNEDGQLRVAYPDRLDLDFKDIDVIREQTK